MAGNKEAAHELAAKLDDIITNFLKTRARATRRKRRHQKRKTRRHKK